MDAISPILAAVLIWSYAGFAANHLASWPPRWRARSRCPTCSVQLAPWELLPIVAYALLRGRCRHCRAAIGSQVLAVETSFVALLPLTPAIASPATALALVAWGLLLHGAWFDARRGWIPDGLTFAALGLTLLAGVLSGGVGFGGAGGGGGIADAAAGASLAAGVLALVAGLAGLTVRGGRDRRERLIPFSYDTLWTAAAVGLLTGVLPGLLAGGLQAAASALTRRTQRLPEPLLLSAWLLIATLLVARTGFEPLRASLQAAGGWALLAGLHLAWFAPQERSAAAETDTPSLEPDPEALGFGDVKLAGALGALLGTSGGLTALALAFGLGALVGLAVWPSGRRTLPFAPLLWLGGYLTLLSPTPLIAAARHLAGLW